ncbi:MAG: hypothetical protein M1299_00855 [Firmicutes bacterium]|nr:hypothetical protein [Bacillota bacterium]
MTRTQVLVLISRIKQELENIDRLQVELASRGLLPHEGGRAVTGEIPAGTPATFSQGDSFTLRAIGSILHDLYVAAENIFETVARELDQSIPTDPAWHLSLLQQMTLAIPEVRPAVISRETAQRLEAFRSFRHVFRNVYGFNLDSKRLQLLLEALPETISALRRDLNLFAQTLSASLP